MAKKNESKTSEQIRNERLNERVPVTLHRPEGEKKDFRTVTVNGVNFQIAYGKQVMIPRYVAEIIAESEKNDREAQSNADFLAKEFAAGKSSLNG